MWTLTYKWALHHHNHRSKGRIIARYFGLFHPTRQGRWVFGDRDSGAYLARFAWTKIVRRDLVKSRASPDDPTLTEYWGLPPPKVRRRPHCRSITGRRNNALSTNTADYATA